MHLFLTALGVAVLVTVKGFKNILNFLWILSHFSCEADYG